MVRRQAGLPMIDAGADRACLYAGTNTGQPFSSRDDGDNLEILADFLPPIQSVEVAVS